MGNFNYNNKIDNFIFDCRWSNNIDQHFINDFLFVQKIVFNSGSLKEFKKQFVENIYGVSIIIVVYIYNSPIAARAVWRNDVNGKVAYQMGAVCVLPDYRGRGLFLEMTLRALRMLPNDALVYSFPNNNSFPGHRKIGWDVIREYRQRLFISYRQYVKEHPTKMDYEYASWWVKGRDFLSVKLHEHYFLIKKDKRAMCFRIVAEINEKIASWFPYVKYGFFFYKSEKKTWYNNNLPSSHLVCRNASLQGEIIPLWKIDAL